MRSAPATNSPCTALPHCFSISFLTHVPSARQNPTLLISSAISLSLSLPESAMFYLEEIPEMASSCSHLRSFSKIEYQTRLSHLPKRNKTSRNPLPPSGHYGCLPTQPWAIRACSRGMDSGRTEREPKSSQYNYTRHIGGALSQKSRQGGMRERNKFKYYS